VKRPIYADPEPVVELHLSNATLAFLLATLPVADPFARKLWELYDQLPDEEKAA
jgi:hypothetical protein